MDLAARIISVVFHPLLMATYLVLIFINFFPIAVFPLSTTSFRGFGLLIFISTFVFPVLNILFFKLFGSIQSLNMPTREERVIPFLFIAVLYGVITYLFYSKFRVGLSDSIFKILIIINMLVVASSLITFFYKVSVHSLGIWGLIGILLPFNRMTENMELLYPTLILIVVAGLVMSARLQLQAHRPREILVGAVSGFGIGFIATILLYQ